jgi:hypothetical protein
MTPCNLVGGYTFGGPYYEARSQTMNIVGAAASSAGAYTYICLYTYIMLHHTYTVYIYLCMHKRKKRLWQDHKIDTVLYNAPCNIAQNILHILYIHFWKWLVSNHGGSTDAIRGRRTLSHVFSGLVSITVFAISQIPSACIQSCSGSIAPTSTPLATRLHTTSFLLPATNHDPEVTWCGIVQNARFTLSFPPSPAMKLGFNHPPLSNVTTTTMTIMMMIMIHETVNTTTRNYSLQEGNQIQISYLMYFGYLKWNRAFLSTDVKFSVTTSQNLGVFVSSAVKAFSINRSEIWLKMAWLWMERR